MLRHMMNQPYPEPLLMRQLYAHKWPQFESESLLAYKEVICAMQDNPRAEISRLALKCIADVARIFQTDVRE